MCRAKSLPTSAGFCCLEHTWNCEIPTTRRRCWENTVWRRLQLRGCLLSHCCSQRSRWRSKKRQKKQENATEDACLCRVEFRFLCFLLFSVTGIVFCCFWERHGRLVSCQSKKDYCYPDWEKKQTNKQGCRWFWRLSCGVRVGVLMWFRRFALWFW